MKGSEVVRAHLVIRGLVQGVGFRAFAQKAARQNHLTGWVKNIPSGGVECEVQGPSGVIEGFVEVVKQGPSFSRVDSVEVNWKGVTLEECEFQVRY